MPGCCFLAGTNGVRFFASRRDQSRADSLEPNDTTHAFRRVRTRQPVLAACGSRDLAAAAGPMEAARHPGALRRPLPPLPQPAAGAYLSVPPAAHAAEAALEAGLRQLLQAGQRKGRGW